MKRINLICLLALLTVTVSAQKITVSGRVVEEDSSQPVEQATVQILALPDSAYINGCVTNRNGYFTLPTVKAGKYAMKVSFVGYSSQVRPLTLTNAKPTVNVGTIKIASDAIMLKEAVVVAQAAQVEVKEDTVQYNVSAYRVPEGSALEELVKKIPGAEVDDEGKITLNGKDISKILVDGKEFFSGDTKVAMKNLTVDMIDKIKAYDKKSDLARITGIDDGEEEAVLDLTVKKGMNQGMFGNVDLAAGTKDRYLGKMMLNRFADKQQFSIMSNLNNVNDMGFPGGGGGFRMGGQNGLNAKKMVGVNFAYENKKIETGGNLRYSHSDGDVLSKTASENFISTGNSSFANSLNQSLSKSTSLNFDYRLEWKPDTMTNVIFRPRASYSDNESTSNSLSATFNADPYSEEGITNPLNQLDEISKAILVNSQNRQSLSNSKSTNVSGELQLNRKLGKNGRNLTLRATGGYSDGKSKNYSDNTQLYYQLNDTTTLNRFINTPTKNYNYSAQFTYSEPIARAVFLQFSYRYTHKYSKSDRNTYNLDDALNNADYHFDPQYYTQSIDSLNKYVENNYDNHDISMTLRWIRAKWKLNVGASLQPQRSETSYRASSKEPFESLTRTVTNFSPTLDFRYSFSKMSQLRINYRGTAAQPSISDLLPITDNSDPLNISMGNPGLKPSFTNSFRMFYNTYDPTHQRGIMTAINASSTSNSVSSMVYYDEVTGGRVSKPENINGNWNVFGMMAFNTALKDQRFTVGTFTRASYTNRASYFTDKDFTAGEAWKNKTNTTTLSERLNLGYRASIFDVSINGSITYNGTRNKFQSDNNVDSYDFSYGASANLSLPWNMNLSTDLTQNSRRGYSEPSYNTNEFVWNAQIAQNFLKGNAATLSLQFFDILRQQSNISRTITAMQRSDTEYNAVNSYCMVHFVYRLNLMGSKEAREKMRGRGFGGPMGGGRPPMGGPRGGFGRPD